LLKKNARFNWSDQCHFGFNKIIYHLTNPPLLAFPDFNKEFILSTDASNSGLGAVLSQNQKEGEKVIGYASRTLKPAEKNYATIEQECLAIVWGIEQFKPYLYGRKFTITSDHNPLVYLENVAPKSKRLTRWSLELAEYDKEIIYKKGSSNTNADALSRMFEENAVIETAIELDDIIKYQESDSFLSSKKTMMRTKGVSSLGKYEIEDGIVYRQETRNKKDSRRLVIPEKLKKQF
jgi:hypothetical protein